MPKNKKLQSINFEADVLEWLRSEAHHKDRSISWIVNDFVKSKRNESRKQVKKQQNGSTNIIPV